MSISTQAELEGMQQISKIVAQTLKQMRDYARPGMNTKELDDYGASILNSFGAKSAPKLTYGFPGWTCISLNKEIAHGIPSAQKILQQGDLINVDVSAELNGFWADNGGSFVVGNVENEHTKLVDASKLILYKAIHSIKDGVKISEIGRLIETEAKQAGYKVIKNLAGHGVGRSLHEDPQEILNCYDRFNRQRFKKNSVVAVETFIATHSYYAEQQADGWTLLGNRGGFVAQHEHTIVITDDTPIILTEDNCIWN
jgi:methionyl aminopeptidase